MSYRNTLIAISEDSALTAAIIPAPKNGKPTIASIEYELMSANPYRFTQDDVQFSTYIIKHAIDSEREEELREPFFAKPKACFRASPLVKKYGWGIHYDADGKVAIYDVGGEKYRELLHSDQLVVLKGMRSKRT